MMISALSLLSFLLATQLVAAASTDEEIIGARLGVLSSTTFGPCTESEYEKVKEVGCMCKEALDAFRNLDNFTSSVSDDCKNKSETCIGQGGATINDLCSAIRKNKHCLTSGSNSC